MGICLLLSAAAFKEILPVVADWTWEKYFVPHFLKGPFWPLLSHMWPPTKTRGFLLESSRRYRAGGVRRGFCIYTPGKFGEEFF